MGTAVGGVEVEGTFVNVGGTDVGGRVGTGVQALKKTVKDTNTSNTK